MAKKSTEFPASQHLVSRIECLIESHTRLKGALENVQRHLALVSNEGVRSILAEQIADALAGAKVAGEAMYGR